MKRFFKSILCGFTVAALLALVPFEGECKGISEQVFRVHILANSDCEADQAVKLRVRDALIEYSEELLADVKSKEQAIELVRQNIPEIISVSEKVLRENGFDYSVSAEVKKVDFNTRYYDDVTMPSGTYDALQVRLGESKGKNWWCVMYPSLCIGAADGDNTLERKLTDSQYSIVTSYGEYELRFRTLEVFNMITRKISELLSFSHQ